MKRYSLLIALTLAIALIGCRDQPKQVFIEVDNGRRAITTEAATVREVLEVAGISLGPLDRVSPDLYVETESGMVIIVTRVEEKFETRRVPVPFNSKTVTNEALPAGETRLLQLGVNGEDEITYRIVLENGSEVERTEVERTTLTDPVDEIIAVGAQDTLPPTPLQGTVAYLSGGNAWMMRDSSSARRPLTTEGDLDGRVFDLSPDERWLLYSRRLEGDIETPLNQLWMVNTTIVGEKPISLPVRGVLYGGWSPDGEKIAYSTARRTASAPGWQANNDLWLIKVGDALTQATQVISSSTAGVYSWWGTTFEWSPDGRKMAYARADQIGVVDIISATSTVLMDFPAFRTYSEWVWVPAPSWSDDGKFVASTIHGIPGAGGDSSPTDPQDSPIFDLWLFAADGSLKAQIANQVGMWAAPTWGQAGVVYGQAVNPLQSVDSRYMLYLRDRDGSNPRRLFPRDEEPGVESPPQVVWRPNGREFIFVYNGNLYLTDSEGGPIRQLTSNNQNSHPVWSDRRREGETTRIQATLPATTTSAITATDVATSTSTR